MNYRHYLGDRIFNKRVAALLFVVMMAFPMRFWITMGPFSSFSVSDVAIITAAFAWVGYSLVSGTVPVGSNRIFGALLIPLVIGAVSLLWTVDKIQTLKVLVVYAEAIAAFLTTIFLFRFLTFESIAILIKIYLCIVIFSAVFSYLEIPGFHAQIPPGLSWEIQDAYYITYDARFSHPFIGQSNNLASILAFFPFILASCFRITGSKSYIWILCLTIIAIMATLSRGVLLSLGIGLLIHLFTRNIKLMNVRRLIGCVVIITIGVVMFFTFNPVALTHLRERLSPAEIYTRIELFQQTINAVKKAPFFGYGAGVSLNLITESSLQSVHNTYLEQLLYFGIIGGIPVLAAFLAIPILIIKIPVLNQSARTMRKAVALSMVIQLLIFMSHPSFEATLLRVLILFSLGIGISLIYAANRKSTILARRIPINGS